MFLGIDIGSSSTKAAVIALDGTVLGAEAVNIGTGTNGVDVVLSSLLSKIGISRSGLKYTVVTGYGRMTYTGADTQITEISCHAKGVYYLHPETRTIVDIGGQDAKVICLGEAGRVDDFVMNEKCAAGTGRFFEVMARVLNCPLEELSAKASEATTAVSISSVCTVFAESEVISQLAADASPASVALGANKSVAKRIAGLCARVKVLPQLTMTGGVALNQNMVNALSQELGLDILVPDSPQTVGALGAAVFARERFLSREKETIG